MDRQLIPIVIVGGAGAVVLGRSLAPGAGVWHVPDAGPLVAALAGGAGDPLAELAAAARDREQRSLGAAEGIVPLLLAGPQVAAIVDRVLAVAHDARVVIVRGDEFVKLPAGAPVAPSAASLDALAQRAGAGAIDVEFGEALQDPRGTLLGLTAALGLTYDQAMLGPLEQLARRGARVAVTGRASAIAPSAEAAVPGAADSTPFRSGSTPGFADLIAELGGSLLISTYQSGRVIAARVQPDGALNTHLRTFDKPMGIARDGDRLALGTRTEIWELRDLPELAPRLEPAGTHDACFVPRSRRVTGDIAIHELGYDARGELWGVATAFSCLVTFDDEHSFVPRWKPAWITELAPGDRCHLNGMAIVEGQVRYVTALGTGDAPGSWRAGKATGGVLIDVASGELLARGLCMPHSPRRHQGRLWVLQSGRGELGVVDEATGNVEVVAQLPGFTRGIDFVGDYAFIGLSQIRESSVFGDLPLVHRLADRECGIWAVDLRTGEIAGFLKFFDLVQEVFDVAFLGAIRFPEIAEYGSSALAQAYRFPAMLPS